MGLLTFDLLDHGCELGAQLFVSRCEKSKGAMRVVNTIAYASKNNFYILVDFGTDHENTHIRLCWRLYAICCLSRKLGRVVIQNHAVQVMVMFEASLDGIRVCDPIQQQTNSWQESCSSE